MDPYRIAIIKIIGWTFGILLASWQALETLKLYGNPFF